MEVTGDKCAFCRGPFHIASGDVIGNPQTHKVCGACVKEMLPWLKGHLNRKWSKMSFYREAYMPPEPAPHFEVCFELKKAGHQAFLVGGCVRDKLLGKTPKDYDVATDARPERVVELFKDVIPTGIKHGTVTVMFRGVATEVTTFRSEGEYKDGRRPEFVEWETDVMADLSRRDFTINAMAEDPMTGEIVDPFGGRDDLRDGVVRCVRSPLDRFAEDGLRCMRAVRFATTLSFKLDPDTEHAITPNLPVFSMVAMERVREELLKILGSEWVNYGVNLLADTGLLRSIFGFEWKRFFTVHFLPVTRPELRLAELFRQAGSCPVERLKLPAKTEQLVRDAFAQRVPAERDDVSLRRWISRVGFDLAHDLALMEKLDLKLARFAGQPLSARDLALDGNGIMRVLGATPGKVVGQASRFLLDRVLEDPSLNTVEQLAEMLDAWKVGVVQSNP